MEDIYHPPSKLDLCIYLSLVTGSVNCLIDWAGLGWSSDLTRYLPVHLLSEILLLPQHWSSLLKFDYY